jgi:hypothetical protein
MAAIGKAVGMRGRPSTADDEDGTHALTEDNCSNNTDKHKDAPSDITCTSRILVMVVMVLLN